MQGCYIALRFRALLAQKLKLPCDTLCRVSEQNEKWSWGEGGTGF